MLVGRESERLLVERLLAGARVGDSGVLVVTGEPGIGKTALLEHVLDHTEGMRVLTARGVEAEQPLAFGGLHQLFAPVLHLLPELPGPQAEALEVALSLREGRRPERFAVGAGVLGLLSRVAEDQPLAVVIDDVHLLDESSAEALAFAARRLSTDPVAVVAAQRGEPSAQLGGLTVLRLGPLDEAATRALVSGQTTWASTDVALRRFHAITGGNPLAILDLAGEADRLVGAPDPATLPLTGKLQAAYLRRAGALSPEAAEVLLLAAADSHDLATLHRACESLGLELGALEEAEALGLVRVGPAGLRFRHPLVRAAVYGAADPAARRRAHRALADAVGEREAARRAWHRAESALGPDEEAARLLETAALEDARRGAHAEAARQLERAAGLSADDRARTRRLLRSGEQAWLGGATDPASDLLEQALDLAGTAAERARALSRLGDVEAGAGSLARARDLRLAAARAVFGEDLVDGASGDANPPVQPPQVDSELWALGAQALADSVSACLYLCDTGTAARVSGQLLALTGAQAPPRVNHVARLAAGIALVLGGDADRGPRLIREALDQPAGTGVEGNVDDLRWEMIAPLFLREAGSSRAVVADVLAHVRERAAVGVLPFLLTLIAKDAGASTAWAQADEMYAEAVRLADETGHVVDATLARAGWSILEARQGRAESAQEHLEQALHRGAEHDVHLARLWAMWARADLAAGQGRVPDALAAYEEVVHELDRLRFNDPDLSPVPELVECQRQSGAEPDAALAEAFLDAATRKGQPWALARAHRAVALAAPDGEAAFMTALELHARTVDVYETARTQLALGAHLRRSRRRVDARPHLREALATFEQLGATPWADRAAAELDATGETAVRRDAGAVTALTPQERQIAALLADGHTTREAAAALFLSPKTVEYHLRHVYLKLGIRSREELAAAMHGD